VALCIFFPSYTSIYSGPWPSDEYNCYSELGIQSYKLGLGFVPLSPLIFHITLRAIFFLPCLSSVSFFIMKLVAIGRSRTSAPSSDPLPSRTATTAIEFFVEGVVVAFLCELTVSSAGCRCRRILCRPPPPASAFGGIHSAVMMRLCLLPPPFLVVVVFGSHTPSELGSLAAASATAATDWIDRHRLYCRLDRPLLPLLRFH
jgi:hypothetical protein